MMAPLSSSLLLSRPAACSTPHSRSISTSTGSTTLPRRNRLDLLHRHCAQVRLDLVGDQLAIALAVLRETLWLAQSRSQRSMNAASAFLQELVRKYGVYSQITAAAWAQYDRELELWKDDLRNGRLEDRRRVSEIPGGNRVAKAAFVLPCDLISARFIDAETWPSG